MNVHIDVIKYNFTKGKSSGTDIEGSIEENKANSYIDKDSKKIITSALIGEYGVATSLVNTGNQWDFPYSWAPINYFAESALSTRNTTFANKIKVGWINAVSQYFAKTGLIVEKYNMMNPIKTVDTPHGYSKAQIGFGWTNGVFIKFYNKNHNITAV